MERLNSFKFGILIVVLLAIFALARLLRGNYYKLSVKQAFEQTLTNDHFISYQEYKNSPSDFFVVDIRNEKQYNASHIENAINIPFKNLLKRTRIKNKKRKWLLYSDDVSKTVKAKLLLNQMGFLNVYYLDFPEETDGSEFLEEMNSIRLNEEFKYKFRPDTTIKPE